MFKLEFKEAEKTQIRQREEKRIKNWIQPGIERGFFFFIFSLSVNDCGIKKPVAIKSFLFTGHDRERDDEATTSSIISSLEEKKKEEKKINAIKIFR